MGCHKRDMLKINGLRYRTNTCTPFPRRLRLLPFLDPSVINPIAGAQLKRDVFLPGRINSEFILQRQRLVSQYDMAERSAKSKDLRER